VNSYANSVLKIDPINKTVTSLSSTLASDFIATTTDGTYFYILDETSNWYARIWKLDPVLDTLTEISFYVPARNSYYFSLCRIGNTAYFRYEYDHISGGVDTDNIPLYNMYNISGGSPYVEFYNTQFIGGNNDVKIKVDDASGDKRVLRGLVNFSTPNIAISNTPGSWSREGRGNVNISWNIPKFATGVNLKIWDGYSYRTILSNTTQTSWNSANAIYGNIYPAESILNSMQRIQQLIDLFNHGGGGLELRDSPNNLYLRTAGNTHDSYHNYFFMVEAVRGSSYNFGEVSTLIENRTDTTSPTGTVTINSGSAYTNSTGFNINTEFH
jgi:hypothetical protein